MDAEHDPRALCAVLFERGVSFIAIGGWAAGVQGAGWPTFDLDIVIELSEPNFERLVEALDELQSTYNTMHQPPIRPDLARMRSLTGPQLFRTRHGRLDVLKEAGGETYATLVVDAVEVLQHGHLVRCASLEALLRMKRAAKRPKDAAGIAAIEAAIRRRDER